MTSSQCAANGGSNEGQYSDYCKQHLKLPYCDCKMEDINDSKQAGAGRAAGDELAHLAEDNRQLRKPDLEVEDAV